VGFTALSEARDPEEVREFLTRYFDNCRRLITLYGGTIEKFIGDAVMAVWGTPTAQEDDAERAVRAAIDLVRAVPEMGAEAGVPDLAARAGVLTGEAAVTVGAEGQGMVAGDLVNTASRIQSLAPPGSILVGEATRRATEAAIVYEDAGAHEVKGKLEPIHVWRASRVVAAVGGALKSTGLEPPFVGRDRELRIVKDLFHASADDRKAHLVSVQGIAGIGKSRLSWEFYKYVDGLATRVYWHRGRSLAYGEGVTYWALAEMVRMRAGIREGEEPASAEAKLERTIEEYVRDAEDRAWLLPRLSHLLGLDERGAGEREDLFAAWRVFFERLAEASPTVLVFEDLQWADQALLDFIEYLLEWSRNHPLFVMVLARPEVAERAPGWGAPRRNSTSLYLEPLSMDAMEALLTGLVPGLPDAVQQQILARAEGVPLYAVETVRMLIDRGLLVPGGASYLPVGPIGALEVPETLHALIAARLDGLDLQERGVIQSAAVLGKTFTHEGLAALIGKTEADLDRILTALVHKEVLGLQVDPRSPERGQYGFLQDLVKRVAYDTLSRRERKAAHLAAARYLKESWGGDEGDVVEILASHYTLAFEAIPDAPDANEIKAQARQELERAGRRAASLAANGDAQRYFEQALGLTDEPRLQALLSEQAGEMARVGARNDQAKEHFERAIELFDAEGLSHSAARVGARLAEVLWDQGQLRDAVERMEGAFSILSSDEPDEDLATLAAQLARFHYFSGDVVAAQSRVELALDIAESMRLPVVLSQALNTKSVILGRSGHFEESVALVTHALKIALEHELHGPALRAYINLSATFAEAGDQIEEGLRYATEGLTLARRVGSRTMEWNLLAHLVGHTMRLGRWDESISWAAEIPSPDEVPGTAFATAWTLPVLVMMAARRGDIEQAEGLHQRLLALPQALADEQNRSTTALTRAFVRHAQGRFEDAFDAAMEAIAFKETAGATLWSVQVAIVEAVEASLALGDVSGAEALITDVDSWPQREITSQLRAETTRMSARIAAVGGDHLAAEVAFASAIGQLRKIGDPYLLAEAIAELAECLLAQDRLSEAQPPLADARRIFDRLGATPWVERIERLEHSLPNVAANI